MAINMISLIRKKQRILQDIFVELSAITVIVSISKLVCYFHRDSLQIQSYEIFQFVVLAFKYLAIKLKLESPVDIKN